MAYDRQLAERIRRAIPQDSAVREVSMFGGLSFMVDGKLALTANHLGDMMLRCDPGRVAELTAKGAKLAEMRGRRMSTGWVVVSTQALAAEEDFHFWLGAALDYNRQITGGSDNLPQRPASRDRAAGSP